MVRTPTNLAKDKLIGLTEEWLLVGAVAQWQSTGTLSQGPGFNSRLLHLTFPRLFCHFKGLPTDSNGMISTTLVGVLTIRPQL